MVKSLPNMKKLLYIILFGYCISLSEAAPFSPPKLNQPKFSIARETLKEIKDCLRYDEFRWGVICEYYGLLSDYYPLFKKMFPYHFLNNYRFYRILPTNMV
jgi:hypothetical protein